MELKNKSMKSLTNFLSKTAGLVFFSFLAISLGVVFGLLFEGWVKDQPGTPVSNNNNLETINLPIEDASLPNEAKVEQPAETRQMSKSIGTVRYKVRVGPYNTRTSAVDASQKLEDMGYPVYVGANPPYAVQVGAFGTQVNADKLKSELSGKGYKVFVDKD